MIVSLAAYQAPKCVYPITRKEIYLFRTRGVVVALKKLHATVKEPQADNGLQTKLKYMLNNVSIANDYSIF